MKKRRTGSAKSVAFNTNSLVTSAGIYSYLLLLLIRIPLGRMIGDAGIGLLAPALEIVTLLTLLTSYSISHAMTGLIRYRLKREQYKNAQKVVSAAFWGNLIVSLVAGAVLFFAAKSIARILVLEPLSDMAIAACGPVVVLASLIGVFRGCFHGYGFNVLVAHSQYLEKIAMLIGSLIIGKLFYTYGLKVSALLQTEAYAYAYAALGAMIGTMLAQLITLLYLLVIYALYAGTLKRQLAQDSGKRTESMADIQRLLWGSAVPTACLMILLCLFMLIDQRLFNYSMNKTERGAVRTALWGAYYGKTVVLIGFCSTLGCLGSQTSAMRIKSSYDKEDYRVMRERLGKAVRKASLVTFPMAIYMAVLAEALSNILFKGNLEFVTALTVKASVLIVLIPFNYLFLQLMRRLQLTKEIFFTTMIAFVVHVISAYFLVQKGLLGADGIVYSLILFMVVYAVLNFLLLCRTFHYKQEWIGSFAFVAVAAGISGLIVMLLNKLLLGIIGGFLTSVISCLLGLFFYLLILMLLRVIGERELSRMPFGFLFTLIGRSIGVL